MVRNVRKLRNVVRVFGRSGGGISYAARIFMNRWALSNLLIGNSDAHAKNISFFQTARGLAPAPMYDLVPARVYGKAILQNLSMAYGDAFRAEDIDADDLYGLSKNACISMSMQAAQMTELAAAEKNTRRALGQSGSLQPRRDGADFQNRGACDVASSVDVCPGERVVLIAAAR